MKAQIEILATVCSVSEITYIFFALNMRAALLTYSCGGFFLFRYESCLMKLLLLFLFQWSPRMSTTSDPLVVFI